MTTSLDRTGVGAHEHAVASSARPVLLATLDAPLLPEASRMAVDSAVESGQPLLVVNAVEMALTRCALTLGQLYITPPRVEEPAASVPRMVWHITQSFERKTAMPWRCSSSFLRQVLTASKIW